MSCPAIEVAIEVAEGHVADVRKSEHVLYPLQRRTQSVGLLKGRDSPLDSGGTLWLPRCGFIAENSTFRSRGCFLLGHAHLLLNYHFSA